MKMTCRPRIDIVALKDWDVTKGEAIKGIVLVGKGGIAAHCTKEEAYRLANRIVDAAEQLPAEKVSE